MTPGLTTASDYFRTRQGGKVRKVGENLRLGLVWPLATLGVMVELGANDKSRSGPCCCKPKPWPNRPRHTRMQVYDSEPLHAKCREQ